MPEKASLILVWASAAEYVALIVSFLVRKDSTLAWSRWLAWTSFSSWSCSPASWVWRSAIWVERPERRVRASRARSSRPPASAALAWPSSLVALLLELGDLQLEALAAGGDVGHAATHLLEQLELLLVGVVQRLARVLGLVQGLVRLGLEDQGEALPEAHRGRPFLETTTYASCGGDVRRHRGVPNLSGRRAPVPRSAPARPPGRGE